MAVKRKTNIFLAFSFFARLSPSTTFLLRTAKAHCHSSGPMGHGASVEAADGDGSGRRIKDSIILKSFRAVDFTEAPRELRESVDSGQPQWALMSALVERHTTQLELRKQYAELEQKLEQMYDAQEKADAEFLQALMTVGHTAEKAAAPTSAEVAAQRLIDEAEAEADLVEQRVELEREVQREKMRRRLQARKRSMRIRSQRTFAMSRHTKQKASLWKAIKNVSKSLQRGFHAAHHHSESRQQLGEVDAERFALRKQQADLSSERRAASKAEQRKLQELRNDLAISERLLESAKAKEVEGRLKVDANEGHKHAQWAGRKMIDKALEQQRTASITVAEMKHKVATQEQLIADNQQAFEEAEAALAAQMMELIARKAEEVDGKLQAASQWVEQSGSDGIVYYWNPFTNVSQWEKPAELLLEQEVHKNRVWKQVVHTHLATALMQRGSAGPLKEEHYTLDRYLQLSDDLTDDKYFYDNLTGETSWDDPRIGPDSPTGAQAADANAADSELAERIRNVEDEVQEDDRWYYDLTRETLRESEDGTHTIKDKLVRAEWVNLEEATIFQLELDICNIEGEIARLEQGDTDGLLAMLEELDDGTELGDGYSEVGGEAAPALHRSNSEAQRQCVDDFMKQEELSSQQIQDKAAMEKLELQERVRQQKEERARKKAAATAASGAP